jgi:hypothetical protein
MPKIKEPKLPSYRKQPTARRELAPTKMILIDTRHVGATFGCEQRF